MATKWEVTRAMLDSDMPSPSRLVMFVLANRAEVETGEIPERFTPSLTDLTRETMLDRSTVRRHLTALEVAGWVVRMRPDPAAARLRGERTRYRLTIPADVPAAQDLGADSPQVEAECSYLGAQNPTPRGTEPPDLGAQNPTPRGTEPLKEEILIPPDPPDRGEKSKRSRGTRIPDGFCATPEMITWARENTPNVGLAETAAFVDWAISAPGSRGVKKDWVAAWRNWMRREQKTFDARGRASPRVNGHKAYRDPVDPAKAYSEGL